MSFLDRVTKAVSETVDRGKKEVDQFRRIQKVKGEIGEAERSIEEARNRIQQVKLRLADTALDLLASGALANPALAVFVEQLATIDKEIDASQALVLEKRAEIDRIKAEDSTPDAGVVATPPRAAASQPAATAPQQPPPPQATPADEPADAPGFPPPLPAAASASIKTCPACGHQVGEKTVFCGECGTKIQAG